MQPSSHARGSQADSRHDDSWEDIPEAEPSGRTRREFSLHRPTLHRRAWLKRPRRKPLLALAATAHESTTIESGEKELGVLRVVILISATANVLREVIRLLLKPLPFLIFFWILVMLLGQLISTMQVVFAPLCLFPGIANSKACQAVSERHEVMPPTPRPKSPVWADYPTLVPIQTATFEQLLNEAVGGSTLSLEIKKAEMATSDLVALVRMSDLDSKDEIADLLEEFIDDARWTGRGLQVFSAKVMGAVDLVLAVNAQALRTVKSSKSRMETHTLFSWSPPVDLDGIIAQTFGELMGVLDVMMGRLVVQAEFSRTNLTNLEERLSTAHILVKKEDNSTCTARSELLSELWTKLGGNKRAVQKYDTRLRFLKELGGYRQQALVHIIVALETLQLMSADMEDLRERVAVPELAPGRVSAEAHMNSISDGLLRLKHMKLSARIKEQRGVQRAGDGD